MSMTHKSFVLRLFPKAVCRRGAHRFTVWETPGARTERAVLGSGWSASSAWENAFRRRPQSNENQRRNNRWD